MADVRWPAAGVILVVAYLVLMTVSRSPFPWNVQWSEGAFLALAAWAIASGAVAGWRPHLVDGLVALYLLGGLPSLLATSDLTSSAVQLAKQGYLALLYVLLARLIRHHSLRAVVIRTVAATAGGLAAVALAAAGIYYVAGFRVLRLGVPMPVPYFGEVFRLYGPFHSPEMFANYLTFALPLILAVLAVSGRRAWWAATLVLTLAAALHTVTHAWAGVAVAALVWVWPRWREGGWRTLRFGLALGAVVLVLALNVTLVVSFREVRYEQGTNPRLGPPPYLNAVQAPGQGPQMTTLAVSYNWMSYYLLKKVAAEAFWRAPLTGIGLGRFHEETERAYQAGEVPEIYRHIDPHSTPLGRLAETGVPGGLTLVALWVGVLSLGLRLVRAADGPATWPARAALAGAVGLLVNSINADVMNFRFLWVGVAMLRGAAELDA